MPMKTCRIWGYDEIECENVQLLTKDSEIDHEIPNSLTDDELVQRLKKLHGDIEAGFKNEEGFELDDEGEQDEFETGWDFVGIARTRTAAIVEWKSDRNHQAITTVIWDRD